LLKLMKLEIRKNNIRTYFVASVIACIGLIGFIYFVAYVAQVENEPDFQNYANIFLFTSVISMFVFCILSTVMYSRFVIEEYKGKKMLLLFSYPVSRKKVLLAKMAIVILFTTLAMILSMIPPFVIFSVTESFAPIVDDTLSLELLLSIIKVLLVLSISVNGIGIIAMRIGFIKKSVPTTIVSSFALCGLFGNAIIGSFGNDVLLMVLLIVVLAAGAFVIIELMNKINQMEIE
jgi:ABC-type transport system involved in multi-copper enzyme maturation permease subunit